MADVSILSNMKKALGMSADYTAFDEELIMHINASLATLTQLGVGPDNGFAIDGVGQTWQQFLGTDARYNNAKQYMYYSLRLAFDPPQLSSVLDSFTAMREECAVRLNIQREDIVHPQVTTTVPDEDMVLDGGEI